MSTGGIGGRPQQEPRSDIHLESAQSIPEPEKKLSVTNEGKLRMTLANGTTRDFNVRVSGTIIKDAEELQKIAKMLERHFDVAELSKNVETQPMGQNVKILVGSGRASVGEKFTSAKNVEGKSFEKSMGKVQARSELMKGSTVSRAEAKAKLESIKNDLNISAQVYNNMFHAGLKFNSALQAEGNLNSLANNDKFMEELEKQIKNTENLLDQVTVPIDRVAERIKIDALKKFQLQLQEMRQEMRQEVRQGVRQEEEQEPTAHPEDRPLPPPSPPSDEGTLVDRSEVDKEQLSSSDVLRDQHDAPPSSSTTSSRPAPPNKPLPSPPNRGSEASSSVAVPTDRGPQAPPSITTPPLTAAPNRPKFPARKPLGEDLSTPSTTFSIPAPLKGPPSAFLPSEHSKKKGVSDKTPLLQSRQQDVASKRDLEGDEFVLEIDEEAPTQEDVHVKSSADDRDSMTNEEKRNADLRVLEELLLGAGRSRPSAVSEATAKRTESVFSKIPGLGKRRRTQ